MSRLNRGLLPRGLVGAGIAQSFPSWVLKRKLAQSKLEEVAATHAVTVLSTSGQESSEEIDHIARPRRAPSGTALAHFARAMAWIALLVFGCLALANRFLADRSFEDYRALFLSANEQTFKNQLRTSGNVLGCVFIAVSLVVLSTRLWEAAESPGQKTLIALWAAFVCLVVFVFRRALLVFRATNPAIGERV